MQASIALASTSPVSVEGGPEGLGNAYQWTIGNHQFSPIIRIEVPHYRATLFFAPKGWTSACTNMVNVGAKDLPGICTATANSPGEGIAQGRSASFSMQIASGAVKRGSGKVIVGFADATTQEIGGVLVPVPETRGDRYIPLIGLGAILLGFFILQAIRRRRTPIPSA